MSRRHCLSWAVKLSFMLRGCNLSDLCGSAGDFVRAFETRFDFEFVEPVSFPLIPP